MNRITRTAILASFVTLSLACGGPPGGWESELSNTVLVSFYSASDYSETETLVLCSDGSAYYSFESYSSGFGSSLSFFDEDQGSWTVDDGGYYGVLNLSMSEEWGYEVTVGEDGGYLLDGDLWYSDGQAGC